MFHVLIDDRRDRGRAGHLLFAGPPYDKIAATAVIMDDPKIVPNQSQV